MSKWLSNLVTPLLILLGTTIITALAKGPIDEVANQNRLKAEIELAPWIDTSKPSDDPLDVEERTASIIARVMQSTGNLGIARVNLENDSGKLVTNISFEIPSHQKSRAIMLNKDREIVNIPDPGKIIIPDMSPGDKITVLVWGSFHTYRFRDDFKSYSSEGRFRANYFWPENQGFDSDSTIDAILSGFVWIGGTVSAILLVIILGIGWAQHSEFIKLLLTYPKAYELEKARFWENPRKFSPDWNLLNEKHYKPHALFGEPNESVIPDTSSSDDTASPEPAPEKL